MISRLLFAFFIFLAAVAGSHAKEWTTVRIGTEGAYPPFNFIDADNQIQGFDIEIGRALCAEMKVECEFVIQDWDGIIPALLAHRYDAVMAAMSITGQRKQQVAFSDRYHVSTASFVARKGSTIRDTAPDAMKDLTLGGQSSTTYATLLQELYAKAGARIRLYATQDEANLDLSKGRLDVVLANKTTLLQWLKNSEEGGCCTLVGEDINNSAYLGEGVGIAFRKTDPRLRAMFNEALKTIRENGTYQDIKDKFFSAEAL
ncbi:amino acid ABC transporter [Agaricicola taiwanensis]|uniref:Amino acid ABC transporter n=1 Tax=Agaricicola taiwanensis TaxID=591372 RepID=A0A8J2VPB3_9RHOB|nr:transporter substrate-binding domain-containing protein [Agaricicola taiwanensis]GGE37344.1 amino acid ABC transporter [Agaricicola taiwanensis]